VSNTQCRKEASQSIICWSENGTNWIPVSLPAPVFGIHKFGERSKTIASWLPWGCMRGTFRKQGLCKAGKWGFYKKATHTAIVRVACLKIRFLFVLVWKNNNLFVTFLYVLKYVSLFFSRKKFLIIASSSPCFQSCNVTTVEIWPVATELDASVTGFGLHS
jgi:hypothetical protein